jgi:hypothetical protein
MKNVSAYGLGVRAFAHGAVARMGGAAFRDLVERLETSAEPRDVQVAREVAALIEAAGANDTISIACRLDEHMRQVIDDKLAQATALRARRAGAADEAAKVAGWLEDEARELLDDPHYYIVSKIQLASNDGRSEFVAAEISLDPGMAQEIDHKPRTQKC